MLPSSSLDSWCRHRCHLGCALPRHFQSLRHLARGHAVAEEGDHGRVHHRGIRQGRRLFRRRYRNDKWLFLLVLSLSLLLVRVWGLNDIIPVLYPVVFVIGVVDLVVDTVVALLVVVATCLYFCIFFLFLM